MTQEPPAPAWDPRPEQLDQPEQPPPVAPAGDPTAAGDPTPTEAGGHAAAAVGDPMPRRRLAMLAAVGALAGVVILVAGGWTILKITAGGGPEPGDCIGHLENPDDVRVVDCDSDQAVWSVVGVERDWALEDFEIARLAEVCQEHPDAVEAVWVTGADQVTPATGGDVACLRPAGAPPPG